MRVLLTGFEPFGEETINPAWEVVQRVALEAEEGITISKRLLPTVFGRAVEEAIAAINGEQPSVVIAVGQAGGRPDITIERVALNIDDAERSDNAQNQPTDAPVVPGAPAAYFSTLPIKKMVEGIKAAGIPASVSNSAGTFVCNHTMYGILHYISEKRLPVRAGFIHLPYLPEQAVNHKKAPSMSLEHMVEALKTAIVIAAE